jgi:hypothetical protein
MLTRVLIPRSVTAYMIIVIQNPSSPNIAFFSFVPSTYILSLLVVLNKRLVLRRVLDHETSSYRGRVGFGRPPD